MGKLVMSSGDHVIQSFPLLKGRVNLESPEEVTDPTLIRCVVDGSFTITWNNGDTDSISCFEGDDYAFTSDVSKVTIDSGKFHVV